MSRNTDSSISFGMGILFGVVAGVLSGIIFAPKSGEETRQELKDIANNIITENKDLSCCKTASINVINKLKYTTEKQIKKINDAIKAGRMAEAKRKEELESEYSI